MELLKKFGWEDPTTNLRSKSDKKNVFKKYTIVSMIT